jgi:hypothetical protein
MTSLAASKCGWRHRDESLEMPSPQWQKKIVWSLVLKVFVERPCHCRVMLATRCVDRRQENCAIRSEYKH